VSEWVSLPTLFNILYFDEIGITDVSSQPDANFSVSSFKNVFNGQDRSVVRLPDKRSVYVEYREYKNRHEIPNIRKLASVLKHVDPESMHMLRCIGLIETEEEKRNGRCLLIYEIQGIPRSVGTEMKWTLARFIQKLNEPRLDTRVQFAVEICMAVMYTHSAGLVHKSIRPENIMGECYPPPAQTR
jgi:serine/threonine protein kinase